MQIIKNVSDNYHGDRNFMLKIKQILENFKETLSNLEIFDIFKDNKFILLFLLERGITHITEEIYEYIIRKIKSNGNKY